MTEDEVVEWHHQFNGHEFEKTPGGGEGQGGLACCSPWGCQESDTTEQLNNDSNLSGGQCLQQGRLCIWGGRVYGKFLHGPLNFALNPKLIKYQ